MKTDGSLTQRQRCGKQRGRGQCGGLVFKSDIKLTVTVAGNVYYG